MARAASELLVGNTVVQLLASGKLRGVLVRLLYPTMAVWQYRSQYPTMAVWQYHSQYPTYPSQSRVRACS